MDNIKNFHMPRWNELPSIDLYMDQILTYIEDVLGKYIIVEEDEKIITKTMINNYVKLNIVEPPIKKKYNRLHLAKLFTITILKEIYSINDIKKLIDYALKKESSENIYNKFCDILEESLKETFSKKENNKTSNISNMSELDYLLRKVIQSYVNKLYVQLLFLKKD